MKPSWSDAPEWANWLAQDQDGEWVWYERHPRISQKLPCWEQGPGDFNSAGYSEPNNGWLQTLERRP